MGTFVYMLYLYNHVGDVWAYSNVQIGWGRGHEGISNLIKYIIGKGTIEEAF